jgi:hypothetical protein
MKLLNLSEHTILCVNESFDQYTRSINDHIKFHIENELNISESIFRIGSDSYLDFVNELRTLHTTGLIKLSENDIFIVENLKTGEKGIYKNESVNLDSPRRTRGDEPGKYIVFRDNGGKTPDGDIKAFRITFGDPNATVKNCDPARSKSFLARHKCSEKTLAKNGMTAGWWSCNVHKFAKELGLSCNTPW